MGKTKGPYNPEFPVGSHVRVAEQSYLEEFAKTWNFHHPLQPEQVQYGGRKTNVLNVTFYHGGDELYELAGVPGIWHEPCLRTTELDEEI